MKIVYNKYLPGKGYKAINLFGMIFARKEYRPLTPIMCNHEAIHTRQMLELFILFFYCWYLTERIIRRIQYKDPKQAYYNISFEREAYANEENMDYLKNRKWYSFLAYLREKK